MTKIDKWEEFFPRLIAANFEAEYDAEEGKLSVNSPRFREEGEGPIGIHYYGTYDEYYVLVPINDITEFYGSAFDYYRESIKKWMEKRLQKASISMLKEDLYR